MHLLPFILFAKKQKPTYKVKNNLERLPLIYNIHRTFSQLTTLAHTSCCIYIFYQILAEYNILMNNEIVSDEER